MRALLILTTLLTTVTAYGIVRVAVIDTGLNMNKNKITLCKNIKHMNFTSTKLNDTWGHGSNVSHIIERYAGKTSYCQVILKVFDRKAKIPPIVSTINALRYVMKNKSISIVNYSGGGYTSSILEKFVIKKLLDKGIVIVVAAGNDGKDLSTSCNYYPACYDKRIIIVGNKGKKSGSNYGPQIKFWVDGNNVTAGGYTMTGSSQATAKVTGMLIKTHSNRKPQSMATDKTTKAFLIQSGMDKKIDRAVYKIKKKLHKNLVKAAAYVAPIGDMIIKNVIEVRYETKF